MKAKTKTTTKKAVAKKTVVKKTVAKKTVSKKTVAKKVTSKKATTKKTPTKKIVAKKATSSKATTPKTQKTKTTKTLAVKKVKETTKKIKDTAKDVVKKVVKKVAKTVAKKEVKKDVKKASKKGKKLLPFEEEFDGEVKVEVEPLSDEETKEYQEHVAEARYMGFGIDEKKHILECSELPWGYGKDKIVLLPIDPHFVYTYWEITENKFNEMRNRIGWDSKLTVRVFDVTAIANFNGHNAHRIWDIDVYERIGSWFMKLDRDNLDVVIEIGLKKHNGEFCSLDRSNYVKLPRLGLAPHGPIQWMVVDGNFQAVITDVEHLTEEDLALLRKMLGDEFYRQWMKGNLTGQILSSMTLHLPKEANVIVLPEISSSNIRPLSSSNLAVRKWPKTKTDLE